MPQRQAKAATQAIADKIDHVEHAIKGIRDDIKHLEQALEQLMSKMAQAA